MDCHLVDHSIEVLNQKEITSMLITKLLFFKAEERPTKLQEDTEKSVSPY